MIKKTLITLSGATGLITAAMQQEIGLSRVAEVEAKLGLPFFGEDSASLRGYIYNSHMVAVGYDDNGVCQAVAVYNFKPSFNKVEANLFDGICLPAGNYSWITIPPHQVPLPHSSDALAIGNVKALPSTDKRTMLYLSAVRGGGWEVVGHGAAGIIRLPNYVDLDSEGYVVVRNPNEPVDQHGFVVRLPIRITRNADNGFLKGWTVSLFDDRIKVWVRDLGSYDEPDICTYKPIPRIEQTWALMARCIEPARDTTSRLIGLIKGNAN